MMLSFSSVTNTSATASQFRAIATPSRSTMSDPARDTIASRVAADVVGFVAPSALLESDLPLLATALLPLQKATHVFACNREVELIPSAVRPFLGHYAPTLTYHDGAPVFHRLVDKPRVLVAVSLNGYVCVLVLNLRCSCDVYITTKHCLCLDMLCLNTSTS